MECSLPRAQESSTGPYPKQKNPAHICTSCYLKSMLLSYSHLRLSVPSGLSLLSLFALYFTCFYLLTCIVASSSARKCTKNQFNLSHQSLPSYCTEILIVLFVTVSLCLCRFVPYIKKF
jgi:hypothetical protein